MAGTGLGAVGGGRAIPGRWDHQQMSELQSLQGEQFDLRVLR